MRRSDSKTTIENAIKSTYEKKEKKALKNRLQV